MGVWIETTYDTKTGVHLEVTPFVGVWIETILSTRKQEIKNVTPFVGVWIETQFEELETTNLLASHPSWVCGLKQTIQVIVSRIDRVTPFVGVWIETRSSCFDARSCCVTPFVGVWIETLKFL